MVATARVQTKPQPLKTLVVSFPVVRYEVLVQYAIPRLPTVFEEAVLRMVQMAERDQQVAGLRLGRVVSELLGIPDADEVFLPVVRHLFDMGLIRVAGSFDSLEQMRLGEIRFTDRGRELFECGELPSRELEHRDECYFDPIKRKLLRRCYARDEKEPAAITLDNAETAFPDTLYRQWIQQNGPEWLPQGAQITGIAAEKPHRCWVRERANVYVHEGELLVQFDDPERTRYVKSLSPRKVRDFILDKLAQGGQVPAPPGTCMLPVDLRAEWRRYEGLSWQFWEDACRNLLEQKWVVVFSTELGALLQANSRRWRVLIEAGSGAAIPCAERRPGPQGSSKWIVRVRDGRGTEGWTAATRDGVVYILNATVRLGAGVETIPLAAWDRRDETRAEVANLMRRIAVELIAGAVQGRGVAALWLSPAEFWSCVREVSERRPRLADRLTLLRRLVEELERIGAQKHLAQVSDVLVELVRSHQGKLDRTALSAVVDTTKALQTRAGDVVRRMIELLNERASIESLEELAVVRKLIRELDPRWTPDSAGNFYPLGVLREICHELVRDPPARLDPDSPLEKRLLVWRRLANRVGTSLGGLRLDQPIAEAELFKRVRHRDPELAETVRRALDHWRSLTTDYPELADAVVGTPVETVVRNLTSIAAAL